MPRPAPFLLVVAGMSALLLVAGCSGSTTPAGPPLPDTSAFAAGTCRTAAPDVLAVGRAIPRLASGAQGKPGAVAGEVRDSLRDAQDRIAALAGAAEPAYKPALEKLVVQIGLVRIRADGNEYTSELGQTLTRDYDAVLRACGAAKT